MPLGVLMLDTRFARFVGDIGNPQSYSEPVLFEVVRGATVDKIVPAKAPPLLDDFVAAGTGRAEVTSALTTPARSSNTWANFALTAGNSASL